MVTPIQAHLILLLTMVNLKKVSGKAMLVARDEYVLVASARENEVTTRYA